MNSSYILGLSFIVLVSVIWSVASILVQYMYQGMNFHSPFLLTYIGTSLFVFLIPSRLLWERWHFIRGAIPCFTCFGILHSSSRFCRCGSITSTADTTDRSGEGNDSERGVFEMNHVIIPWSNEPNCSKDSICHSDLREMEGFQCHDALRGTIGDNATDIIATDNDCVVQYGDQQDRLLCKLPIGLESEIENDPAESITLTSASITNENLVEPSSGNYLFSHQDHMKMAMKVAPIWFISNYFYNLSLAYTTITSSTVLSSTGTVFTFIFSLTFGDEKFTAWKMLGVSMAFLGSIITSYNDASQSQSDESGVYEHQLWGDAAGLISAVGYGGYTVLIRILCPTDENRMSMQLFLGYIGLMNMLFLSPIFIWVLADMNCQRINNHGGQSDADCVSQKLTAFILACLVMKGLLDNVLSDYLWARAIILTSATVATVGLGLTIPLALVSDIFLMQRDEVFSFGSISGAIFVLVGFICVNVGQEENRDSLSTSLTE